MAKKKKKQQQTFLSPEKYIKQKARTLRVKACYISDNYENFGIGYIIVAREHNGGRITAGFYLVDKFCLGVKDTFFKFRVDDYEFDEMLDDIARFGIKEISYEEAHNRIFGAVEFAEEAGIKPHEDFAITKYILEEDDDNVPLIEYEYGVNGQHHLMAKSSLEASRYLPLLKKNLGDNFNCSINDEGFDDEDFDDEDFDDENSINTTVYTYKHPEYPQDITLEYPIVEKILCDPNNANFLKPEHIDTLLALSHDSLRNDLEKLLLYHIGMTCDGIPDDASYDEYNGVVANAVILLGEVGNHDSSLDVVLEVLRQSDDFYDYHICDNGAEIFVSTIYMLGHDRLDKLMDFMKEEGLYVFAKVQVLAAVAAIVPKHPKRRSEIIEWFRILLVFATEKLHETKFIDSTVAGFIVCNLIDIKAKELLPEIKALFDTRLVDESLCGNYNEISRSISKESPVTDLYVTDIYKRYEEMSRFFQ